MRYCSILLLQCVSVVWCQLLESNFFRALSGYGSDICRYMSCPFGQLCMNGVCSPTGTSNSLGMLPGDSEGIRSQSGDWNHHGIVDTTPYMNPMFGGLLPSSTNEIYGTPTKYCTSDTDCLIGENCVIARCTTMALGLGSLAGVQPCSLRQQCLNGQICVNGFCSQSNIVYRGNQLQLKVTSCSTGAVCPIGQSCVNGVCVKNSLSQTFACSNGICPYGMTCYLGRCMGGGFLG
ncbi:hypothetical protein AB6A40_003698 [Gnathostoma spinigerum]|uniref:EB domain-containing protein n=1 Tax=Gnathostoma spinigerum TaxID=75299 RepID=A0ABD6EFU7_9BILA